MSKVYVVQETNHDFSDAETFGSLVFLSVDKQDDFHNIRNSEHNTRLISHLRRGLADFDADRDFIILAGSPYVSAAVFWILGRGSVRFINVLRWDNRDRRYVPLPMQF